MKKLLVLLFTASSLFAQTDIQVTMKGPVVDIGRGLNWQGSGLGNFNNNYVLSLSGNYPFICVGVHNNNPSSGHSFNMQAAGTLDQRVFSYQGNAGSWFSVPVKSGIGFNSSAAPYIVTSLSTVILQVSPNSSARTALIFSGGSTSSGSPDTVDIFAFGSVTGCPGSSQISDIFIDSESLTSNKTVFLAGMVAPPVTALFPANPANYKACTFYVQSTNLGGTSPTLNVYVQNYEGSLTIYDDRISFNQFTTGTSYQASTILTETASNPAAPTNGTLAAGSTKPGLFDNIAIKYVLGGTSPSYVVNVIAYCH